MLLSCLPVGGAELWSQASSWPGGPVQAGQVVTIPAGREMVLDVNPPPLGGLIIHGSLTFARQDLHLTAKWILIDGGILRIGTEEEPFQQQARITLTGTDETENIGSGHHGFGTKFIGTAPGGRLELHGPRAAARNWTRLGAHALAGANSLTVAEAVDWRTGDRLVLAPGGFNPLEAEELTVTAVAGNVIQFMPALRFDHWGELQTIHGHMLDERAEVACLTRNILIEGDSASGLSRFGGHLMFHHDSSARIGGVEFSRMGQMGHVGRYPIHWHLVGDAAGDYAKGNSIHHSYHRGIVTHGTSDVLVERNVCYDVWSHVYVPSENGTEMGNRYQGNLAILTRPLAVADFAFPSSTGGNSTQSESRPGAFWMKSPDQILTGNHVSGVINGMGFFYDGPGAGSVWKGAFQNNVAHSCSGPSGFAADRYPYTTVGYGLFMSGTALPADMRFSGFTAYKNSLSAAWLESPGHILENAMLADNGTAAMLYQSTLRDSVIIGQSANTNGALPVIGTSLAGGVHLVDNFPLKAPQLERLHFINQRDAAIVMLGTRMHPRSTLRELTFTNTLPCRIAKALDLLGGFTDVDGSLREDGVPVYIHGSDDLPPSPQTVWDAGCNAWITPLADLQFLSLTDSRGLAGEMGFTLLVADDRVDFLNETGLMNGPASVSGYVRKDRAYDALRFDPLPDGTCIRVEGAPGGFLRLNLPVDTTPFLYDGMASANGFAVPDFSRPTPRVASLAELDDPEESHAGPAWFSALGSFSIDLRVCNQEDICLFDQTTAGLDVTVPEAMWRSQQFGYLQAAAAPPEILPAADPDGDGLNNRLEYFLGTNPLRNSPPVRFTGITGTLSYSRNPAATDMIGQVMWSQDLANWHEAVISAQTLLPDGTLEVHATAPAPLPPRLFMVLKVTPQP